MAKLPIYNNQANINIDRGVNIENVNTPIYQAVDGLGRTIQDLSVEWQKTQNAAEALDGKNKIRAKMNDIINEAKNFNDWESPIDIENKENELNERLNRVVSEVASGFTNARNRADFENQYQIDTLKNTEQLKGIFRKKYIDNNNANLVISNERNMKSFIETGNIAYKNDYLSDLENSFKAGYISKEEKTRLALKTEDWEQYMILRQAETDPDAVISNLKEGKYNVKPEDMNELLKSLNSVKTNKQLLAKYEETVKQDQGESETVDFIYGSSTYDEKLQFINNKEFSGDISGAFAQKARRVIKKYKPEAEKRISNAQSMADVLQRVYDLNDGTADSSEYLNGIRSIRESVIDMHSSGDITTKDAISLNNQINNATRARISEATSDVGYKFSDAKNYFKTALPPEYQNEAIRDLFYATQNINFDSMDDKEKKSILKKKAIEVSENIMNTNRLGAEKAYTDITTLSDNQFISELAVQKGRDVESLNKDIDETAQKYGLTREQVINKLRGNM